MDSARLKVLPKALVTEPFDYHCELGIDEVLDRFIIVQPAITAKGLSAQISDVDMVVSCLYHSSIALNSARVARRQKKLVVYFSDGVEEWDNMTRNPYLKSQFLKQHFPAYADLYFVCSDGGRNFLTALGKQAYTYMPKRAQVVCGEGLRGSEPFDILITTANSAYFDGGEFVRLCDLLKMTLSKAEEIGLSVCFRVFDKKIIEYLAIDEEKNIIDGDFGCALDQAKCVFTTPSTVALTAMKAIKPTALFDYRDSPLFVQGGWRVHRSTDIEKIFREMLARDEDRMLFQATQTDKNLDVDGIGSVLLEAIKLNSRRTEMLLSSRKSRFSGVEYYLRSLYRSLKKRSKWIRTLFVKIKKISSSQ